MARLKNSSQYGFPREVPSCSHCGLEFDVEDVEYTWKCPDCDEPLLITGSDPDNPERSGFFVRKLAPEITRGDFVILPGPNQHSHNVFRTWKKGGRICIALEGFGTYEVDSLKWVNCIP